MLRDWFTHFSEIFADREAWARFLFSPAGQWTVFGLALLLALFLLWITVRRRRRALENLGLSKLKRELTEAFKHKRVSHRIKITERSDTPIDIGPLPELPHTIDVTEVNASLAAGEIKAYADTLPAPVLLRKLPFTQRAGLHPASARTGAIAIEAVFVSEGLRETLRTSPDPVVKLLPFMPESIGTLMSMEKKACEGPWIEATPHALIRTDDGVLVVTSDAQSALGVPITPEAHWKEKIPLASLLEALLNALIVSRTLGKPTAPLLLLNGVVCFLRIDDAFIETLLAPAPQAHRFTSDFLQGAPMRASHYAQLLAATLSAAPERR